MAVLRLFLGSTAPGVDVPPGEPLAVVSTTARARAAQAATVVRGLAPTARTVRIIDSHHGGSWRDDLQSVGFAAVDDPADVVVDNHELSHQPNLREALADRVAFVRPGGRLVLEFFHFQSLVEQRQVDNVRHGHPLLLTVSALWGALGEWGFEVVDAQPVPVYGGSILLVAARAAERPFRHPRVLQALAAERAAGVSDPARLKPLGGWMVAGARALNAHLLQRRDRGIRVAGYGAPSKACILLGVAGIGPELMPYTVDLSAEKVGRRIPGCGVPILHVAKISQDRPDEVLILCWDLASEVVRAGPAIRDWGGHLLGSVAGTSPVCWLTRIQPL